MEYNSLEYLKSLEALADQLDTLKLSINDCLLDLTTSIDLCNASLLCKSIPCLLQYRSLNTVEVRAHLQLASNVHIIHGLDFAEDLPPGKSVSVIACEDFNTSQLLPLVDYIKAYQPILLIVGKHKPIPKISKLYSTHKDIKIGKEVIGSVLNA